MSWWEEDAVHDGKNRSCSADPERQDQNRHQAERDISAQCSESMAQILEEVFDRVQVRLIRTQNAFDPPQTLAKGQTSSPLCLIR